jgi:DNA-directed RNA polymerase specialized sigma24 family protein
LNEEKVMTENEQKKEFLQSYQLAKRDVTRLEEQLAELRIGKMSPGCDIGDGLPHAHNATDLSGYAAKVDELEDEIIAARYQRILAYQQVRNCIEALEDEREKMLLTYRYIRGLKWEEICVKMDYKWRQVHRIHAMALKNLKMA